MWPAAIWHLSFKPVKVSAINEELLPECFANCSLLLRVSGEGKNRFVNIWVQQICILPAQVSELRVTYAHNARTVEPWCATAFHTLKYPADWRRHHQGYLKRQWTLSHNPSFSQYIEISKMWNSVFVKVWFLSLLSECEYSLWSNFRLYWPAPPFLLKY